MHHEDLHIKSLLYHLEKLGAAHADVYFFYMRQGGPMPMNPAGIRSLMCELRDPVYRNVGRKAAKEAYARGWAQWAKWLTSKVSE